MGGMRSVRDNMLAMRLTELHHGQSAYRHQLAHIIVSWHISSKGHHAHVLTARAWSLAQRGGTHLCLDCAWAGVSCDKAQKGMRSPKEDCEPCLFRHNAPLWRVGWLNAAAPLAPVANAPQRAYLWIVPSCAKLSTTVQSLARPTLLS